MLRTTGEASSAGMDPERLACIRTGLQSWVDRGVIAGASVALARRGAIVYVDQVGWRDKEAEIPMGDDAIFRIYSMTKPIICCALMTLYEEGRFQLTAPVSDFIPALGACKVLQRSATGKTEAVDLAQRMTVRDLMAHTSGLTYDFLVDSPVGELYRQAQFMHDSSRTLAEFVEVLAALPLAYQPGSRWHYSLGIDVAAYLIELLADQPLGHFLHERLFAPLQMVDTDFGVAEAKVPRLAAMYGVGDLFAPDMTLPRMIAAWEAGRWEQIDAFDTYPLDQAQRFARGGHGLFSTTHDYLRFALMLANGGTLDGQRILGRKTVELMHANHIPTALLPWEVNGLTTPGYGFGLGSRVLMDVGAAGLPGSVGEFGWAGAASTYYWIDPQEELVGVFMTQYQGQDAPDLDFRVLAYQAIAD